MGKNIAEKYAEFAEDCNFDKIPNAVKSRAKELLYDFIGVALAGYKDEHLSKLAIDYANEFGGTEICSIIGQQKKYPAPNACFSNAVISHAIDLDDGHKYAEMHPSVVIIPAVLSAAEVNDSTGKEILNAIIIGYEIALRVGRAVNPDHLNRGFHSSSTCAPFGAAAAAAKLYKLTRKQICSSISLAGLQGAGLQEMLHEGQASKPYQVGKAAQSGFLSAYFSKKGLVAPSSIFEGNLGWLKAVTNKVHWEILDRDLGLWWDTLNIYTKPYPTCRHVHPGIDIGLEMPYTSDQIRAISYYTYGVALMETGNIFYPENEAAAKFSLPYGISIAIQKKEAGIEAFSAKYLKDEGVKDLISKISLFEDEKYSAGYPDVKPGKMIIELKNGETIERESMLPIGEPEVPISASGLKTKFRDCTDQVIPKENSEKLHDLIENLEAMKSVMQLFSLCQIVI